MKKTDNIVININGNNNNVNISQNGFPFFKSVVICSFTITIILLAVLFCCPEKFAEFVRWIVSIFIGN